MKKKIIISLPSKGRLRLQSLKIFKKKGMSIKFKKGNRDLIGKIENRRFEIICIFQHARESIFSLGGSATADIAISGIDLLLNSDPEIQNKIKVFKKLNFGNATLGIFCMNSWIDCQTMLDVSEIATEMLKKNKQSMKCSTKYRRLVENFLDKKNVKNVEVLDSVGATEVGPRISQCSLVADIFSSGATAKANGLRLIKDGRILDSSAALLVSKKSFKREKVREVLKLLSK